MILGIDLGNVNVKTSEKIIYQNKISNDERLYDDADNIRVIHEGIKYTLGQGEFNTNYIKADRKDLIINLLTAIALSTNENIIQVILGLPVQQYKVDKDRVEDNILSNRINNFKINDNNRQIIISDCKAFPEGLAAYYSLGNCYISEIGTMDIIIIDIGGRTTNIILYSYVNGKRKLMNYITIPAGTLNIYSDFINSINDRYSLGLLREDAADILKNGLYLDGEKRELKFTRNIFERYTERIMAELRLNYPIRTSRCILTGGGGLLMKGLFMKQIKGLIHISNIFANAEGFKKVGESIWH